MMLKSNDVDYYIKDLNTYARHRNVKLLYNNCCYCRHYIPYCIMRTLLFQQFLLEKLAEMDGIHWLI